LQAVVLHGHVYVRSAALWKQVLGPNPQTASLVARIDDNWVDLSSAGSAFVPGFNEATSGNLLRDCLVLGPHGTLTKGGVSTVNGYSAVELTDKGETPGSVPGRWYVATDSPHFFMRFVATGPRTPGGSGPPGMPAKCTGIGISSSALSSIAASSTSGTQVDFTKINQHIDVTAPSGAIDIRSLMP
jgi:hypothetical protein